MFPNGNYEILCTGVLSSKEITTRLAAVSARSLLPFMFICPQMLLSFVGSPRLTISWSVVTMAAIKGLVVIICCVGGSIWLFLHCRKVCLRVCEDAYLVVIFLFV